MPVKKRGWGQTCFGSTKAGIAPFYADKYAKIGVQLGELFDEERLRRRLDSGAGGEESPVDAALPGSPR